jgi:hypothetical protein
MPTVDIHKNGPSAFTAKAGNAALPANARSWPGAVFAKILAKNRFSLKTADATPRPNFRFPADKCP